MNARSRNVMRANGIDDFQLPTAAVVVPIVWTIVFLIGIGLIVWAWVR